MTWIPIELDDVAITRETGPDIGDQQIRVPLPLIARLQRYPSQTVGDFVIQPSRTGEQETNSEAPETKAMDGAFNKCGMRIFKDSARGVQMAERGSVPRKEYDGTHTSPCCELLPV